MLCRICIPYYSSYMSNPENMSYEDHAECMAPTRRRELRSCRSWSICLERSRSWSGNRSCRSYRSYRSYRSSFRRVKHLLLTGILNWRATQPLYLWTRCVLHIIICKPIWLGIGLAAVFSSPFFLKSRLLGAIYLRTLRGYIPLPWHASTECGCARGGMPLQCGRGGPLQCGRGGTYSAVVGVLYSAVEGVYLYSAPSVVPWHVVCVCGVRLTCFRLSAAVFSCEDFFFSVEKWALFTKGRKKEGKKNRILNRSAFTTFVFSTPVWRGDLEHFLKLRMLKARGCKQRLKSHLLRTAHQFSCRIHRLKWSRTSPHTSGPRPGTLRHRGGTVLWMGAIVRSNY